MGYITQYTLTDDKGVVGTEKFNKVFKKTTDYCIDGDYLEGTWYHYDEDMIEISKKFPKVTFKLKGIGEDEDDVWACCFRDGKYQDLERKIIWSKLNEGAWR